MRLDKLKKPNTLWFEDSDGEVIDDIDISHGMPPETEWHYMRSKNVYVADDIFTHKCTPLWPVRIINWILGIMPNSWKYKGDNIFSGKSLVRGGEVIVTHLVLKNNFLLEDAIIIYSDMCHRCRDICNWEIAGINLDTKKHHLSRFTSYCKQCKHIDARYSSMYKVRVCYASMKAGGDVAGSYKNCIVQ